MIEVRLQFNDAPKWTIYHEGFKAWIVLKLEEAGVPTTGGPINKSVDLSKGRLSYHYNCVLDETIYKWETWEEINASNSGNPKLPST